jgi:hypothetical protein
MGFMSYMTVQIIEELKTMGEWDKFANGPEHIEKVGMAEDMGDEDDDKMPSGESEKHGGASEGIYNPDRSLEFFLISIILLRNRHSYCQSLAYSTKR